MSLVTVPVLGFGIVPFGPNIFPRGLTIIIVTGVAITTSKSSSPFLIFSAKSSIPTASAPASNASFACSASAKTATLQVFPVPAGKEIALLTV